MIKWVSPQEAFNISVSEHISIENCQLECMGLLDSRQPLLDTVRPARIDSAFYNKILQQILLSSKSPRSALLHAPLN